MYNIHHIFPCGGNVDVLFCKTNFKKPKDNPCNIYINQKNAENLRLCTSWLI